MYLQCALIKEHEKSCMCTILPVDPFRHKVLFLWIFPWVISGQALPLLSVSRKTDSCNKHIVCYRCGKLSSISRITKTNKFTYLIVKQLIFINNRNIFTSFTKPSNETLCACADVVVLLIYARASILTHHAITLIGYYELKKQSWLQFDIQRVNEHI